MTPPPDDSKPGGVYYAPPPGRPAGSSGGCLKAAGLTCGVLFLLLAVGAVWLGVTLRNAVRHPGAGGGFLGALTGTVQAVQEGQQIRQAVVAYRRKNGQYPRSLTDLVADGETDGRDFHSALDPDPSPAHISWRYYPPAAGAPATAPLLVLRARTSIGGGPPRETPIVITLGGSPSSAPPPPDAPPPAHPGPLDGG